MTAGPVRVRITGKVNEGMKEVGQSASGGVGRLELNGAERKGKAMFRAAGAKSIPGHRVMEEDNGGEVERGGGGAGAVGRRRC